LHECCRSYRHCGGFSPGCPTNACIRAIIIIVTTITAQALVEEVRRGGVVDSTHQALLLTLCALGPQEVNQVRACVRACVHVVVRFASSFLRQGRLFCLQCL
jgi:hypothetical protein